MSAIGETVNSLQKAVKEMQDVVGVVTKGELFALIKELPEAITAIAEALSQLSKRVSEIETALTVPATKPE